MHAELCRVDVNRNNYGGGFGGSTSNQGNVSCVQGAHGGDEGEGTVVDKLLFAPLPQRRYLTEDFDFGVRDSLDRGSVVSVRAD